MKNPPLTDQVPDVIITLLRGSTDCEPVSFCRLKAADLLQQKFNPTPQWFKLVPDRVTGVVEETKSPGQHTMH